MYYTGHGVQIDGENYFVPIDCEYKNSKAIFTETQLVGINAITDFMTANPSKTNIMILDACRSNPGFSKDVAGDGLTEVMAGNGTLIYGSYLEDTEDVMGAAWKVALFDTLAALLAAFVIIRHGSSRLHCLWRRPRPDVHLFAQPVRSHAKRTHCNGGVLCSRTVCKAFPPW